MKREGLKNNKGKGLKRPKVCVTALLDYVETNVAFNKAGGREYF